MFSLLRAPSCQAQTTSHYVQPDVTSLPPAGFNAKSVASQKSLERAAALNDGFVFDPDGDDDDEDDFARVLEYRLSSARVLPLGRSSESVAAADDVAQAHEGRVRSQDDLASYSNLFELSTRNNKLGRSGTDYKKHGRAKKVGLMSPDHHELTGGVTTREEGGRRGSSMGHRWRSMPMDRGFSLAWDEDFGVSELT